MIDINIKDIIPHRYPFLLLDRILEYEDKKRIVGIKNVTINEPFFPGHFPEQPIMPGVLILESMAQTAAVLFLKDPEYAGRIAMFAGIENAKFRKPVVPGDQLRLEMETIKIKGIFMRMHGKALVDGKVVCEGNFFFTLTSKPTKAHIHPTATVHSSAILGKDVTIGPYTIIGENCVIGENTTISAHVMVDKYTRIGKNCHISFGSVLGSEAQDVKYGGEETWVIIGDNTTIREYVTINRSTGKDSTTKVGSDCILMTNVHIGHNCQLGNGITVANMTNMAGHVEVEDFAIIGGMTGIHQFARIGKGAMVGAYTRLPQDVPPFMLCEGNPAIVRAVNAIGLKRKGATVAAVKQIREIHKLLFRSNQNITQAMEEIVKIKDPELETQHLIEFLKADSKRGLTKKPTTEEE
jgi:UDP-N-acetylglucosamine acyltransferase